MSTTRHRGSGAENPAENQEQGHWLGGVREGYADLSEVRLHYVEAGDGPLVVSYCTGFPNFGTAGCSRGTTGAAASPGPRQ
jgi:hypothetical protein